MTRDARGVLLRLLWALWPGAVLHEVTHALVATLCPGTGFGHFRWWPRPAAGILVEDDAPLWSVWAVWYAPWLVGIATFGPVLARGIAEFPSGPALIVALWVATNAVLYLGLSAPDLLVPMQLTDERLRDV